MPMITNSATRVSLEKPSPMQKALVTPIRTAANSAPLHAAKAPHHGDDESVGDHGEVEVEIGGLARDLQRAAQSRPAPPRQRRPR